MRLVFVAACLLVAGPAVPAASARGHQPDLVRSVTAAPVTPDGTVAGRVTDLVIDLDTDPDPRAPGRSLRSGDKIRIVLPAAFRPSEPLPFLPFGQGCPLPPAGTVFGNCNVAVLLHGWPQRPILPFAAISTGYDAQASTITLTARQDIVAAPPAAPGIKQIHLLLPGFRNPAPGAYTVRVEAETGDGGALETGSATLRIVPATRPSVAFTSVFNAGRPSPLFQMAAQDSEGVPFDLLLWDRDGGPLSGVTLSQESASQYLLRRGGSVVGSVTVDGPARESGLRLSGSVESSPIAAPVTAVPVARLRVGLETGSDPGNYVIGFRLLGGEEVMSRLEVR